MLFLFILRSFHRIFIDSVIKNNFVITRVISTFEKNLVAIKLILWDFLRILNKSNFISKVVLTLIISNLNIIEFINNINIKFKNNIDTEITSLLDINTFLYYKLIT